MINLVSRILASAAQKMWRDDATLAQYTAETAQYEPNLSFHYAAELRHWFSWLDCDFDVMKPNHGNRRPDIIFHRRRSHLLNSLVIEVKRGNDIAGADEDVDKIRNHWFGGNLLYRFGASVILGEQHGMFDVRILERAAPAPFLSISNQTQFQSFRNPPRSNPVGRQSLRTLANTVASGRVQEDVLDAAINRLYRN